MNHHRLLALLLPVLASLAFTGCEPDTLYFSPQSRRGIEHVPVSGGTPTVLIPRADQVVSMAVAPSQGKLYAVAGDAIRAWNLSDGSHEEVLLRNLHLTCLALDTLAERVYWGDGASNHIASCNLQGGDVRVLVTGVNLPSALAVNPNRGLLYWSQQHPEHGLWMAQLDGSQKRRLSEEVGDPRPIAVDRLSGRLFRATSNPTRIIAANHDGSDPKTIATLTNRRVDGLAVDETARRLIWIERRSAPALPAPALIRSARFDGSDVTTLHPFTDGDYALSLAIGPARSKP